MPVTGKKGGGLRYKLNQSYW